MAQATGMKGLRGPFLTILFGAIAWTGWTLAQSGSALPLLIGVAGMLLAIAQTVADLRSEPDADTPPLLAAEWRQLGWFGLLFVTVLLIGFLPGAPLWMLAYLWIARREGWSLSIAFAAGTALLLWSVTRIVPGAVLFAGLLRT